VNIRKVIDPEFLKLSAFSLLSKEKKKVFEVPRRKEIALKKKEEEEEEKGVPRQRPRHHTRVV
jgi:hypothetical protein